MSVYPRSLFLSFVLGMTIVVFFKCMTALFDPVHRRGEYIKWGLIPYTVAIFSSLTIYNAVVFNIQSFCYIDNRNFPGGDGGLPPGPLGCQLSTDSGLNLIAYITFLFNGWLADGLLVSSLLDGGFTRSRCLMPAPPVALPLLRNLLQEALGHRLPLPHVPRLCGYVLEVSTKR